MTEEVKLRDRDTDGTGEPQLILVPEVLALSRLGYAAILTLVRSTADSTCRNVVALT
jgi:hypothetical protein